MLAREAKAATRREPLDPVDCGGRKHTNKRSNLEWRFEGLSPKHGSSVLQAAAKAGEPQDKSESQPQDEPEGTELGREVSSGSMGSSGSSGVRFGSQHRPEIARLS